MALPLSLWAMGSACAQVLYENREKLMPLLLRILFAKATHRGKQLEKRSTQVGLSWHMQAKRSWMLAALRPAGVAWCWRSWRLS